MDDKSYIVAHLSEDQLKHLKQKYKIDRMECFMSLVDLAEPVPLCKSARLRGNLGRSGYG